MPRKVRDEHGDDINDVLKAVGVKSDRAVAAARDGNAAWMEQAKSDAKAAKQSMKAGKKARSTSREGPEPRSLKQMIIGCTCLFIMCGVGLFQTLAPIIGYMMGTGVVEVDVQNTKQVKDVLFSGSPWLVYCVNDQTRDYPLPQILVDTAGGLKGEGVRVAQMNCWEETESGRTLAQRFKLPSEAPVLFFVANGNSPKVVHLVGVKDAEGVMRKLRPMMLVKTPKVDSLKTWQASCIGRRACVVIGHTDDEQRDGALEDLKPLLEEHRSVRAVTLDTDFWSLRLERSLAAKRPERDVVLLCLVRKEGTLQTDTAFVHGGAFHEGPASGRAASAFLAGCGHRSLDFVDLEGIPQIKARKQGRARGEDEL